MELFSRKAGSGEPLIILHGLFGSGMNWNTLSKFFGARYEVFLVDQRNHGKSPHDDEFNYEVMAADLAQFFRDNQLGKASILGHSMGAKTALTFAVNYPAMVDKLIAVDMGIKEYPVQDEAIQQGLLTLDFDVVHSRGDADRALEKYIPDWGTRQFIMQNLYWGDDKKMHWRMNVRGILDNIDEIGKAVQISEPYSGKTLFVKAANSDYIESGDHASILEAFPQAIIKEIPDAGHWVHADNPTQFGEVVMKFLSGE